MAKSFIQSSRKKKAAEKLKQLRRAEHLDAMQNSSMLITLLFEDAQHRYQHGYGLLPDNDYWHWCDYFYHRHDLHIGGYGKSKTETNEDNETKSNKK